MILVTGGTGLLGESLRKHLPNARYVNSLDADLRNESQVSNLFNSGISLLVHLAARVGGIRDNIDHQYEYFYDNVMMNTHVINECVKKNIDIIALSSTCVYPKVASTYPMIEDMVMLGEPEPTNKTYAYSKRMMQVQLEAARQQYGLNYIIIYAGNLYGPHDVFGETKSHLVASLFDKMHIATNDNKMSIPLFGTGKPLRQFTYVEDVARAIVRLADQECFMRANGHGFNIANPENLSVREIAETVAEVIGYKGAFEFDGSLDGVYRKDVSNDRFYDLVENIGFVPLLDGVRQTYDWYRRKKCGS